MMKWILVLFFPVWVFSQKVDPFITTFSSHHGLPSFKIFEMATDSAGYLWLGSNLGLHRFDGITLKTYNTLPNAEISDIQVRSDGKVFVILANHGLAVYNEFTESFDLFNQSPFIKNLDGLDNKIAFGKDNRVFLSLSGYGLLEFNLEGGEYTSLLEKQYIRNIATLNHKPNQLILGGDSIFLLDVDKGELAYLSDRNPINMTIDKKDNLWINDSDFYGYVRLNIKNGTEEVFLDKEERPTYFLEYNNGIIWSDAKDDIVKFTIDEARWEYYNTGNKGISGIYVDKLSRVWFGQNNKLNVIDPQNQFFKKVSNSDLHNYVDAVDLGDGKFGFLSFSSNELHVYNIKDGSLEVLEGFNSDEEFSFPFSMTKINGDIWISFSQKMVKYNIEKKEFKQVEFSKYNAFFSQKNKLNLHGENGFLWISSISDPILFRVDPNSLEIDSFHYNLYGNAYEWNLYINEKGKVKLPSNLGLIEINFEAKEQRLIPYFYDGDEIDLRNVDAFLEEENKVWLSANGSTYQGRIEEDGVYLEDELKSHQAFNYSDNMQIVAGLNRNKIILTSAGIRVFDELSNEFKFWGIDEGLINVDRRTNIKKFGKYLFFLSNGILYVDQNDLKSKQRVPEVFISSFKVNEVKIEDESLSPSQNDIKIKFESIDLTKPLDVIYKYRLSQDNPWIETDYKGNEVYFLDLKPGEYNFEVRAKHKFSEWSDPAYRSFEIKSPFWKKWWFAGSVLLGTSLLIFLYYRYQLKKAEEISWMKSRMNELENEALRAQMNPHFIFNSLNSIKSYIIDHDKEEAADYLTNFSDLIRLILANSREQLIPLERELSALKLYMDIENIRLDQKFTYEIINEIDEVFIQPLTLQPFIENAIWHGFIHKKDKGHLLINIKKENNNVVITILDDGVGRKKSQVIEKKHSRKRSFGILITKERLARAESSSNVTIEDIEDQNGEGIGTKVTVIIPYQISKS